MSSSEFLKRGPSAIVRFFLTLPSWRHASAQIEGGDEPVSRFVWDTAKLPVQVVRGSGGTSGVSVSSGLLLVTCHGDLVCPEDPVKRVSFDRAFLLKENASPTTR